jgi:PIN domain nuclease of toxin-antitoxin system
MKMNRDDFDAQEQTTFVTDTHTIYWYFNHPERLSAAAEVIFRLAETGNALIVVPAIVVAELYFLLGKRGQPLSLAEIFRTLDGVQGIYVSALGRAQLERLSVITDISEMHDRLIAAEALILNAPIVTQDAAIVRSQHIRTIW